MPREVFLAPGGSPFVQSTTTPNEDIDASLPDMSSRYFCANTHPEDLNSSRALAGLEDISADMAEDESPMRFRSSVSDELLMGIKGGEFLADDSVMGFDTSLTAKPFESRSKLMESTSIPPSVSEEPEEEKPKRKKSTRSRSKSPSKKSIQVAPIADTAILFPSEPIETTTAGLVPEPQPEADVKPRRTSPRKARSTRPPSTAETLPPSSITPSNSSSNPFSTPPVADSTPTSVVEHIPIDDQAPPTAKTKRTSRATGRSKSKNRSKTAPAEVDEEHQAETASSMHADNPGTSVDQRMSPPAEASQPPTFASQYLDIANKQTPVHVRAQSPSASVPFKFHTQVSADSRNQGLTPLVPSDELAPETPTLDTPTPREPTKDEEDEAVASALRILRRDSAIFPRLRQSIAPIPVPEPESVPIQEETTPAQEVIQKEPVHKRTRVGRASRARGGASVSERSRMDQVLEETQKEEEAAPGVDVDAAVEPEGETNEPEPELNEDIAVPVNFGSRTPSPVPAQTSVEPSQPELEPKATRNVIQDTKPTRAPRTRASTAAESSLPPFGTKTRVTRASLPAQAAHATRTFRMSEGRPTVVAGTRSSKPKQPELAEQKEDEEQNVEETLEQASSVNVSAATPERQPPVMETTQPAIIPEPAELPETTHTTEPLHETSPEPEPEVEQAQEVQDLAETSTTPTPASTKPTAQRNALGVVSKGVPQRGLSSISQKPPSKSGTRAPSGQRSTSATQKPPSKTAAVPAPRATTTIARKPSPATQKPASTSRPARTTVPQEPKVGPATNKAKTRPTRTLPKRASAGSKEQASVETVHEEVAAQADNTVDKAKDQVMEEIVKEASPEPIKAGPFEHKRPAFQPILARRDSSSDLSSISDTSPPRPNKRRASPGVEPEQPALDSPSKRVRFSADLEAGPTPSAGPSQAKPKPSIKPFTKPNFQLKASRPKPKPKRTLTRNAATPSYAAPLKRNIVDNLEAETPESERAPLSESHTNTRSATNKLKPTVPVEFTFRSELRMKPPVETPLPNTIPVALPMPDFAAAHAAAEAANLARRERAQAAFLAAQAELESFRASKHEIGSETARRAAERAVFDAAMKVKEAEAERVRVEEKRLADEREAAEIKELRKRMVPKANPVPEWYKHVARNENEIEEGAKA